MDATVQRPSVDYVDLTSNKVERKRIEKLFAIHGLNSPEVDSILDRHFETPIAQYQARLIENRPSELRPWALYSALRLLFSAQMLRFNKVKSSVLESIEEGFDRFL